MSATYQQLGPELSTVTDPVPVPAIGDGASYAIWTDRHACTVVKVSPSGKRVTLQQDRAIRLDTNGMSEVQSYRFEADSDGRLYEVSLRKLKRPYSYWKGADGKRHLVTHVWKGVGLRTDEPGGVAHFSGRSEYHDFSF